MFNGRVTPVLQNGQNRSSLGGSSAEHLLNRLDSLGITRLEASRIQRTSFQWLQQESSWNRLLDDGERLSASFPHISSYELIEALSHVRSDLARRDITQFIITHFRSRTVPVTELVRRLQFMDQRQIQDIHFSLGLLVPRDFPHIEKLQILDILLSLETDDMNDLVAQSRFLFDPDGDTSFLPAAERLDYFQTMARMPQEERASYADELSMSFEMTDLLLDDGQSDVDSEQQFHPGAIDTENVMRNKRIVDTLRAARDIMSLYRQHYEHDMTVELYKGVLEEVESHLEQRKDFTVPEKKSIRNTLSSPRSQFDLSDSLMSNSEYDDEFGLGQLAAAIWKLADQKPDDKENIVYSFYKALAECIEEDGHRVCSIGISQRLVTVLQGYFDEVSVDTKANYQQYLIAVCEEFMKETSSEIDEKTAAAFNAYALSKASEYFSHDSVELGKFKAELEAYLKSLI